MTGREIDHVPFFCYKIRPFEKNEVEMGAELKLFVYGSYCEGMVHYNKLENFISSVKPAKMRGSVYRLEVGYPVVLLEGNGLIEGQLLSISRAEIISLLLDEFHGYSALKPEKSLFLKSRVRVDSEGGEEEALVYSINPTKLPKTARLIEDADWRRSMREEPVYTEYLTEKQMAYVKKLGQSSGRDIVPIDLDLYRELMKLDLIVDKGRRLALSRLGKEVYRYSL